ncbi:hypothetical protein HPY86_06390 [candidate division WOR-3 bacterium]|nr:hypothetical protein [candidate division WOR-3 bacterium]
MVKRWIGRFPNDADRPIDTAWLRVHIPHDVGTLRIVAPVGVIDSGTAVTPQVWIKNYGHRSETFSARFRIGAVYDRRVTGSTLRPGSL